MSFASTSSVGMIACMVRRIRPIKTDGESHFNSGHVPYHKTAVDVGNASVQSLYTLATLCVHCTINKTLSHNNFAGSAARDVRDSSSSLEVSSAARLTDFICVAVAFRVVGA